MNKAASKRLISKQEAVVLLGGLDLFDCTDTIESVSISNSKVVRSGKTETKKDNDTTTFVARYKTRPSSLESLSLYEYFHHTKNGEDKRGKGNKKTVIPNFVGVNGTPRFPVTESYARHVLVAYKPWRVYPKDVDWISEFDRFINCNRCPSSARMNYCRVMRRYYDNMTHYEPKSHTPDHSSNPISDEDKILVELLGLGGSDDMDYDTTLLRTLNRGFSYEWDKAAEVRERSEVKIQLK